MKHVAFARGRYAVRISVPPELRPVIGKRELVEPLGADKRLAERNAHAVIAGFLATIEDARERLEASKPTLSAVAKAHYRVELGADDLARGSVGTKSVAATNALFAPHRASLLRLVVSGHIVGEEAEALVGYAVDAMIEAGLVKRDHVEALDRRELLRSIAEAQLDVLTRAAERDQGIMIAAEPRSPLLTQPDPEPATPAPDQRTAGATLGEILIAFHKERTAGNRTLAAKTMDEHKTAIRMLEEHLGGKIPARSITRKDMLAYGRALLSTEEERARFFVEPVYDSLAAADLATRPSPSTPLQVATHARTRRRPK